MKVAQRRLTEHEVTCYPSEDFPQGEAMPGIGIISNPKSRQNRKHPEKMRRLAYILGSKGEAAETRSLDDLYQAAEEFKRERIDVLGINGGDGSLHLTLTILFQVYQDAPLPKLAILRGGTLNTIATGLGIFGTPEQILYNIVEKYHSGEPFTTKEVNTLSVDRERYGFIFGNGIISNFLEIYYETGKPSPSMAARLVARGIGSTLRKGPMAKRLFQRVKSRVSADGEQWAQEDFLAIGASTVPQIGLGFTPWYRVQDDLERFQVLGIHCSPAQFVLELPRIYRAQPMRRDRVIDLMVRHLSIEADAPIGYMIDGDHYTGRERLELTLGPRLEVILP